MEAYQQRVILEEKELFEKIERLLAFRNSDRFKTLDKNEQRRMGNQYLVMCLYEEILRERIENFPK